MVGAHLVTVSVVICTRNRSKQLSNVLESLCAQHIPDGLKWEAVIVDNGSTDDTQECVARFQDRLPLRCVFEPVAGLSNARNTGVAEANGEYICWTDDDVRVDENWLSAYAEAFQAYPDAAFFGGTIQPVLEGTPPDWFIENRKALANLLAERDFGPDVVELSPAEDRMPFGANFAVRSIEQKRTKYNPELGVKPNHNRVGEETDVLNSIARMGGKGIWVHKARVFHLIPESRQTIGYVRQYHRAAGATWAFLVSSGAIQDPKVSDEAFFVNGAPMWALLAFAIQLALFTATRWSKPSKRWLKHLQHSSYLGGAIDFWTGPENKTLKPS